MADANAWPAVRLCARTHQRRRWAALLALGVLAGVTAGFAMASLAGARRADTAVARFRAATHAADAVVFASQVGQPHPNWDALRAKPEVADLAVWNLLFGTALGDPNATLFVAGDGFGDRIGQPRVLDGRMWDPNAEDEVVVTPEAAALLAPGRDPIGFTFTMQTYAADQGEGAPPSGPVVQFKVVGVVETINYFLFVKDQTIVSPAFAAKHRGDVMLAENADVVLRHGAADIDALTADVNTTVATGAPVLDLHAASRRVDTTISVERAALLLLAAAIAVAGGLLVGQALGRSAASVGDDAVVLRAAGLTRGEIASAAVLSHAVAFATAIGVALLTAVLASRLFPVGLSRQIDPDVGIHADWLVLGTGLGVLLLLLMAHATFVARRAARPRAAEWRLPSRTVALVRRIAPTSIGLGTTMALDGGAGRSRVAVRPALVGAIVGVVGVIGALTIQHAVDDSLAHPERAGVTWSAAVAPPADGYDPHGISASFVDSVAGAAPRGSATAVASRYVVQAGSVGVAAFSVVERRGEAVPIRYAVTGGRAPASDDEVAVGPKTLHDLHADIGDTIVVGDDRLPVRVVGTALFPPDVHAEFDEGLWLTNTTFERLVPDVSQADLFQGAERYVLVRYPRGVDPHAATAQLGDALRDTGATTAEADIPVELQNLRNVRTLPLLLAVFLGLLAVAAVAHVLVSSSRRRRHDFAVLRAIGFNPRGTRIILNAQASTISLVGIVIGVPLGIAAGRTVWRWVANQVPLENVPPFAVVAVLLVLPATIVLANALAVWPARSVARLAPGDVLRAE